MGGPHRPLERPLVQHAPGARLGIRVTMSGSLPDGGFWRGCKLGIRVICRLSLRHTRRHAHTCTSALAVLLGMLLPEGGCIARFLLFLPRSLLLASPLLPLPSLRPPSLQP